MSKRKRESSDDSDEEKLPYMVFDFELGWIWGPAHESRKGGLPKGPRPYWSTDPKRP